MVATKLSIGLVGTESRWPLKLTQLRKKPEAEETTQTASHKRPRTLDVKFRVRPTLTKNVVAYHYQYRWQLNSLNGQMSFTRYVFFCYALIPSLRTLVTQLRILYVRRFAVTHFIPHYWKEKDKM